MTTRIKLKLGNVLVGIKNPQTRRVPHNMSNQRMHWAEKKRWNNAWAEEVGWAFMANRNKFGKLPLKKCKMTFKLFMTQPYDLDGAYRSIKPLLDAFKVWKDGKKQVPGLGVIVDDSPKHLDLCVKLEKVKKRDEEHVEIIISY